MSLQFREEESAADSPSSLFFHPPSTPRHSSTFQELSPRLRHTRKKLECDRSQKNNSQNLRPDRNFSTDSMDILPAQADTAVKQQLFSSRMILELFLLLICVVLTYDSLKTLRRFQEETASMNSLVWASGWITCAFTGIGALPFFCFQSIGERAVAYCNAIAAGMMLSASLGLIVQGGTTENNDFCLDFTAKMLVGIWLGVGFIKIAESSLGDFDEKEAMADLGKSNDIMSKNSMQQILMILCVMTVHSFAEGVAVGVSYHSQSLGSWVTTTLAIHNVPEGLAIGIVLIPRGVPLITTLLLCIASSFPQPVMAVPAFVFVDYFSIIVPIGLGFAAGAMLYVAVFELFVEAKEELGSKKSLLIASLSSMMMIGLQLCV